MLMDLFYDTLPPNVSRKRRVHFHAFMIDIHKALHRQAARGVPVEDAIAPVARDLAKEVEVLCFDEFQVRLNAYISSSLKRFHINCDSWLNRSPTSLMR